MAAAMAAGLLAGCGSAGGGAGGAPKPPPGAAGGHPLRVVATAFPLAQLVSYIGGTYVRVTDLVPPGTQPEGLVLTPTLKRELAGAALVVDLGDGYQPQVEAAVDKKDHLSVLPAVTKQPEPYEIWLDPYLWSLAAGVVTRALNAADPARKRSFENAKRDFQSLAFSVASDYQNSLSECPLREFVTADDAFGRLASAFSLVDVPLSTTSVQKAVGTIAQYSIPDVFAEQGVASPELSAVARRAHVGIKTLDPMELTPAPGTKYQSYFSVMEANLSALEGPLECDTSLNYS
jgi:ABC-type Zn uptake system ZnuABC Zn-binding protein ZnuA